MWISSFAAGSVHRRVADRLPDKEWMSLWGKVVVPRRLYQEDHGGPSRVPLDERCGMVNRFMVPELERVTAFLGARLVPAEVEDSLGEVLPEPPSRTAIQHVLTTVGQCAEDGAEQLELALQGAAPLDAEGDTLVVSWDGVTVPLREPAPKRGRPAERPMATATDTTPTAWKEAGVGMVATYLTPLDPEVEEPERVDVRYAARMPEAKMTTLVNGLVEQTARALHGYDHRVVLADGKREIWRIVDEHGVFEGFTRILDFYHAAQHLSMAAEHLFGKKSAKADRWYRSWRHKLRHTPNAVAGLIRSFSYHRRKLRRRSDRYRQATTERNNRDWNTRLSHHLQWPCGGRRQDHRRPPTQTQRHAMDPPRRSADPQPTSPGAIETMGCFLELVSPADHTHNNPEKGSVKTRLHPNIGSLMWISSSVHRRVADRLPD